MREKATELKKGFWYADTQYGDQVVLLRYDKAGNISLEFDMQTRERYMRYSGKVLFMGIGKWYIPTQEDLDKHGLKQPEDIG